MSDYVRQFYVEYIIMHAVNKRGPWPMLHGYWYCKTTLNHSWLWVHQILTHYKAILHPVLHLAVPSHTTLNVCCQQSDAMAYLGRYKNQSLNIRHIITNHSYIFADHCGSKQCPGEGFMDKNCQCICPGEPTRLCSTPEPEIESK